MSQLIKNIAFKGIIIMLVVQTLNLSMNSLVFYSSANTPNAIEEQDYVDSMVEYLIENMLGFSKNTFHDKANANNTSKQQQNTVHFDLKWLPGTVLFFCHNVAFNETVNHILQNDRIINLYFKEVPAKPPRVLSA